MKRQEDAMIESKERIVFDCTVFGWWCNMLNIYVCEDDAKQREYIIECIQEVIDIEEMDMGIVCSTDNPKEMLKKVKEDNKNGIFFLDIDLKQEINGIELAAEIRKTQPRCYIIFVTTHLEMSYMTFTYKVEAMDYIIKDNVRDVKNRIHQCLINCQFLSRKQPEETLKNYMVKFGERVIAVPYDDIMMFEVSANSNRIILYAKTCQVEFIGKMKEVEKELDQRFYRCHRSYMINRDNIAEINDKENQVVMKNGITCPTSVRLRKGL